MKNDITITGRGIVISKHASGVICVYDSRHRILKVPVEGGVVAELIQERTSNGTIHNEYRNQLLTIQSGRDAAVLAESQPFNRTSRTCYTFSCPSAIGCRPSPGNWRLNMNEETNQVEAEQEEYAFPELEGCCVRIFRNK